MMCLRGFSVDNLFELVFCMVITYKKKTYLRFSTFGWYQKNILALPYDLFFKKFS